MMQMASGIERDAKRAAAAIWREKLAAAQKLAQEIDAFRAEHTRRTGKVWDDKTVGWHLSRNPALVETLRAGGIPRAKTFLKVRDEIAKRRAEWEGKAGLQGELPLKRPARKRAPRKTR